jgi:hypothetical protein
LRLFASQSLDLKANEHILKAFEHVRVTSSVLIEHHSLAKSWIAWVDFARQAELQLSIPPREDPGELLFKTAIFFHWQAA